MWGQRMSGSKTVQAVVLAGTIVLLLTALEDILERPGAVTAALAAGK